MKTKALDTKPNFINRWFCKWCLGWEWVDTKTKK